MCIKLFLNALTDEYFIRAAQDIFELYATTTWPDGVYPNWIKELTQDIEDPFPERMDLAITRVKDEIMRRFINSRKLLGR